MQRYLRVVTDANGNPASGVSALVIDATTGNPASIYSATDNLLDSTVAISNPIVTSANGQVAFAAVNGRYTVNFSGGGVANFSDPWVSMIDGTGGFISTGTLAQFDPTTSAQLATVLTDETGTGFVVYSTGAALSSPVIATPTVTGGTFTSPTIATPTVTGGTFTSANLVTPTLGAATGTSINGVAFPTTGTFVMSTSNISALAASTSAQLRGVLSDETGTGVAVFGTAPTIAGPILTGNVTMTKTSGEGIKVDPAAPTFPWADMIGLIVPDAAGAGAPALGAFIGGNVRRWAFSASDRADCEFHIPHDYLPGSDLYIHCHWAHNGTAISGTFIGDFYYTYAKGHNQANFSTEKQVTATYNTANIATTPRYRHRIEEVQLSSSGGSATLLDSGLIEVDGVLGVSYIQTAIPTITGGSPNEPFVFFIDIHYQSTGIGTKQKAPPFWT